MEPLKRTLEADPRSGSLQWNPSPPPSPSSNWSTNVNHLPQEIAVALGFVPSHIDHAGQPKSARHYVLHQYYLPRTQNYQ